MPITLLDILLLVVMLISGLLAMIRGFMREILSIGAWGVAALVTLYSYSRVVPIAKQYVTSDTVAAGITIGGIFLLTLLIVSIVTVRISDMVLDSRVGALDRGECRVAEKIDGRWQVHAWLKKAVLLYFRIHDNTVIDAGYARFYDRVPLKFASTDAVQFGRPVGREYQEWHEGL